MQPLTKKTLKKIQQESGHQLAVADFDLFEELDRLAEKIAGVSPEERRLLNSPYELCGIKFYPITIAKSLWYAEKTEEWAVDDELASLLLIWLLTLPLTDVALECYTGLRQTKKSVRRLIRRLHCTQPELQTVFDRCVSFSDGDGEPAQYSAVIALLMREYGNDLDYWLYMAPSDLIAEMIGRYSDRMNAEEDASRSASAAGGKAVAPQWSAKLQALKDFREKTNAIREKWSEEDDE